MKNIFLGYDLFGESVYWRDLDTFSSLLLAGLSGSGKTYLSNKIMENFHQQQFKIFAISDKVYVDFKNEYINKIDPHSEKEKLKKFIDEIKSILNKTKAEVEKSQFSHINYTNQQPKIFILVDELWSINKLDKTLRTEFEDLCELIIRQGRYLGLFILFISQVSSVAETNIPVRQCSIIITGRTDTKQLSESLFGTEVAYSNPALNKVGSFVFWDRRRNPIIIKVSKSKEVKGFKKWLFKLLKKI